MSKFNKLILIQVVTYVVIAIGIIVISFTIFTNFGGFKRANHVTDISDQELSNIDIADTLIIEEQVESGIDNETKDKVVIEGVSVEEAYKAYISDNDHVFIDVRSKSEYENGHIKGALNIPLSEIDKRVSEIPMNKPIIVYCNGSSCIRSGRAAVILLNNEYSNIYILTGSGIIEWIEKGYPTEEL